MKRYTPWPNDRWIDTPLGQFVLASDAEAAISAAEQRGYERATRYKPTVIAFDESHVANAYEQGQQDMLAGCIEAVEDLFGPDDYELRWLLDGQAVLAALRELQEKP